MAEQKSCRDLYLTQIQYLEEQLESFPILIEEMDNKNKQLQAKRDATEKSMREKIEHLKHSVETEEKIVTDLFAKMESLSIPEQEAENEREQSNLLKLELIEENKKLLEENAQQSKTLDELKEQLEELSKKLEIQEMMDKLAAQREKHQTEAANLEIKFKAAREKIVANLEAEMELCVERKPSIILENERYLHTNCLKWINDMESDASLLKEKDDLVGREETMESSHKEMMAELSQLMVHKTELNKGLQRLWKGLQEQVTENKDTKQKRASPSGSKGQRRSPVLSPEDSLKVEEAKRTIMAVDMMKEELRIRELTIEKRNVSIILKHIMAVDKRCDPEYLWMTQRLLEIMQSCAASGIISEEELKSDECGAMASNG